MPDFTSGALPNPFPDDLPPFFLLAFKEDGEGIEWHLEVLVNDGTLFFDATNPLESLTMARKIVNDRLINIEIMIQDVGRSRLNER
jgi:hypothetical protein